ncbi:MAG: hypothetical protein AB1756_08815, partial [Acidobacteriota bacterium]
MDSKENTQRKESSKRLSQFLLRIRLDSNLKLNLLLSLAKFLAASQNEVEIGLENPSYPSPESLSNCFHAASSISAHPMTIGSF